MLFDFKANNFLCFVVPTTKKEDYLLIQYIVEVNIVHQFGINGR